MSVVLALRTERRASIERMKAWGCAAVWPAIAAADTTGTMRIFAVIGVALGVLCVLVAASDYRRVTARIDRLGVAR